MTLVSAARLLDTPPEEAFDRLTRLAARLLGAPVALVTLAGERPGLLQERRGPARAMGQPPGHAARPTPSAVTWSRRGAAGGRGRAPAPARPHQPRDSRAVAGSPMPACRSRPGGGSTAGALCVIDALPRIWSPRDVALLEDLAASVVTEIELRSPRCARPGASAPPPPVTAPVRRLRTPRPACSTSPRSRWVSSEPTAGGSGSIAALADLLGTTAEALAGCPADAARRIPLDRAADAEAMRLLLAGECASYASEKRAAPEPAASRCWVSRHRDRPPRRPGEADRDTTSPCRTSATASGPSSRAARRARSASGWPPRPPRTPSGTGTC